LPPLLSIIWTLTTPLGFFFLRKNIRKYNHFFSGTPILGVPKSYIAVNQCFKILNKRKVSKSGLFLLIFLLFIKKIVSLSRENRNKMAKQKEKRTKSEVIGDTLVDLGKLTFGGMF
jgi:hypothetical protein